MIGRALVHAAAVVALWSGSADTLRSNFGVPAGKLGQDGDAKPARDEALQHLVVVALEADPRLEPGRAAELDHLIATGAGQRAAEPVLVSKVGDPHGLGGCQRMSRREGNAHGFLVDHVGLDVSREVERKGWIVEDDREVAGAGAHRRLETEE